MHRCLFCRQVNGVLYQPGPKGEKTHCERLRLNYRPLERRKNIMKNILVTAISILLSLCGAVFAEESIDASDPTRVYTYGGGGIKYTDYTNSEEMWEGRLIGNIGLSESDMVLFEIGYGSHSGDRVPGSNNGITNGRARWFHLFKMDYSTTSGYRGLATQVDMQIAGGLKGTNGQNTLSIGALPAFGLNEKWSFYLPVNVVNTWDKNFDNYNGLGFSVAPLLVFTPDWWEGAYLQLWPNYLRFISGELSGEGAGNIDLSVGGGITSTVFWALTYQKNLNKDLRSLRRGHDSGLTNDQNIFLNITTYF